MLLTGEYICKVDEKGRLSVPSRLRTILGTAQVVVTRGFDGQCLSLFTPEFFEKTVTSAISGEDGLEILSPVARKFTRKFVSPSQTLDLDSAGRINIPQSLREYADISLKSEILVVGMGKYVELWNRERYEELDGDDSISDLAEELNRSRRN